MAERKITERYTGCKYDAVAATLLPNAIITETWSRQVPIIPVAPDQKIVAGKTIQRVV
jgi:hypothetical protein